MTHVTWIIEYSVGQIIKNIWYKPSLLEWNERKLRFNFMFSFEFNIVNYDKSFADYETEEI